MPKVIVLLSGTLNACNVLVPQLVACSGESCGRAIQDVYGTGSVRSPDVLAGNAYGQVHVAVAIEIPCSQGIAELIVCLRHAFDVWAVLVPKLVARGGKPTGRAVQNVYGASIRRCPHILIWNAHR